MTSLLRILAIFLILPSIAKSQGPSKYEYHRKIIDSVCVGGKGNNTFIIGLTNFEKILLTKTTRKGLEKVLPAFSNEGKVSFSYNDQTKDHDMPNYEIHYGFLKNGVPDGGVMVTVKNDINNPITALNVLKVSSLKTDQLIQAMKTSGYLFRESISKPSKKYFQNDKKGFFVIISSRADGSFNFSITKS